VRHAPPQKLESIQRNRQAGEIFLVKRFAALRTLPR
jgi:hypothetical protein